MNKATDNIPKAVKLCTDLKARYQAGERDFTSIDLTSVDLSGVELNGAILSHTILRGANLQGAQLRIANLDGADLYGATLDHANLEEASLEGAFLNGVSGSATNFRRADLRGAHLLGAIMPDVDFRGADLRLSNLLKANLCRARLEQSNMMNVLFEETNLEEANLEGADIRGASFRGAKLDRVWVAGVKFNRQTQFWRSSLDQMTGDPVFSRFARDQDYIESFRVRHPITWGLWAITSDCGRSMTRWLMFSSVLIILFGVVFLLLRDNLVINVAGREVTWFTYFYYSIVTFTTLGFGDVLPRTTLGEVLVSIEVFSGYLMLGGLVSIFANKLARRS